MGKPVKMILAATEEGGIGLNGSIPWKLPEDKRFFAHVTTRTADPAKKNGVIMGHKTWKSLPPQHRPLKDRVNIVLSHNYGLTFPFITSMEEALKILNAFTEVESIFLIGGSNIYNQALVSGLCDEIYLTEIMEDIDCDTFALKVPEGYERVALEGGWPFENINEVREYNGIRYRFTLHRKLPVAEGQ